MSSRHKCSSCVTTSLYESDFTEIWVLLERPGSYSTGDWLFSVSSASSFISGCDRSSHRTLLCSLTLWLTTLRNCAVDVVCICTTVVSAHARFDAFVVYYVVSFLDTTDVHLSRPPLSLACLLDYLLLFSADVRGNRTDSDKRFL